MIKIVARMTVKKDKVEEFKEIVRELIEKSRAEEGNIFYTLNQNLEDAQKLTFIECWKDEEAIRIHNATPHFTTIVPEMGELCEGGEPTEMYTEIEY